MYLSATNIQMTNIQIQIVSEQLNYLVQIEICIQQVNHVYSYWLSNCYKEIPGSLSTNDPSYGRSSNLYVNHGRSTNISQIEETQRYHHSHVMSTNIQLMGRGLMICLSMRVSFRSSSNMTQVCEVYQYILVMCGLSIFPSFAKSSNTFQLWMLNKYILILLYVCLCLAIYSSYGSYGNLFVIVTGTGRKQVQC